MRFAGPARARWRARLRRRALPLQAVRAPVQARSTASPHKWRRLKGRIPVEVGPRRQVPAAGRKTRSTATLRRTATKQQCLPSSIASANRADRRRRRALRLGSAERESAPPLRSRPRRAPASAAEGRRAGPLQGTGPERRVLPPARYRPSLMHAGHTI